MAGPSRTGIVARVAVSEGETSEDKRESALLPVLRSEERPWIDNSELGGTLSARRSF